MPSGPIFAEESNLKTIVKVAGMIVGIPLVMVLVPIGCVAMEISNALDEPTYKELIRSVASPDGHLKAVVFAWSPDYEDPTVNAEVSIIRSDDPLPDGPGNVFECAQGSAPVADKGVPIVSVAWKGPHDLLVTYDDRSNVDHSNAKVNAGGLLLGREVVSVSYRSNKPFPQGSNPLAGTWSGRCSWEGHVGTISFRVAQFGRLFDLKMDGRSVGEAIRTTLDMSGQDDSHKTRLKVANDRITGTFLDRSGMAYKVNATRSGPTVWVAPDP